jgi:DNA-binding NarL/FixJ family response regulator
MSTASFIMKNTNVKVFNTTTQIENKDGRTSAMPIKKSSRSKSEITRVVLADDHTIVRAGIRSLLERASDIIVIAEAKDGLEALQIARSRQPDVLLLDMEMPYLNGNEVAEKLKEEDSPVSIIALSAHDDTQYILGMIENGASGYLMKEEAPEILVKAVRNVARGETGWLSNRVAEKLANYKRSSYRKSKTFTLRELDILKLLSEARSNGEIAEAMQISENILDRYIKIMCLKLEVATTQQLLEEAVKEGLV